MPHWRPFVVACLAMCACGTNTSPTTTVAGPLCATYCGLAVLNCKHGALLYTSMDTCAADCATYSTAGQDGDISGNTVQCRISWLMAADTDPTPFCRNASAANGTACL